MSSPGTAATRSGRSCRLLPEQSAEPARLRHGELARLGARAARDVRHRAGAADARARRRAGCGTAPRRRGCAPTGTPGSDRRSRGRCRRRRPRASSPTRRICADVRSPSDRRDDDHASSPPASAGARSCATSRGSRRWRDDQRAARRAARCRGRSTAVEVARARSRRSTAPCGPTARAACSTGGCSGSNGSGAPPAARKPSSSRSNSARKPSQPERLDEELQPVALLVLVVAEPVEDADDRLGDVEHLAGRQELEQHVPGAAPSSPCRRPP